MSETYSYDTTRPERLRIVIDGKLYALCPADGDATVAFQNAAIAGASLGKDGHFKTIRGLGNLEPLLVSRCLFEVEKWEEGQEPIFVMEKFAGELRPKTVTELFVRKLPGHVQKDLYKKARKISKLKEGEETDTLWLKALSREDAPVDLEALREWAAGLPDEFEVIRDTFEEAPEEWAKN